MDLIFAHFRSGVDKLHDKLHETIQTLYLKLAQTAQLKMSQAVHFTLSQAV